MIMAVLVPVVDHRSFDLPLYLKAGSSFHEPFSNVTFDDCPILIVPVNMPSPSPAPSFFCRQFMSIEKNAANSQEHFSQF